MCRMARRSLAALTAAVVTVLGLLGPAGPASAKPGEAAGNADMSSILPQFALSVAAFVGIVVVTALVASATRKRARSRS